MSEEKKKRGRPARKSESKRLWLKVPVTCKDKLEQVSDRLNSTKTDILIHLINDTAKEYNLHPGLKEIKDQADYVHSYNQEHFGNRPIMEEEQSQALTDYYKSKGYSFGSDEDSFILP
ncbi:hypothetical protein M5X06_00255 [Paenibacillus alvei]|uniref:Uncharacterized protein n=1 Tax=Paenibacillus alvei TaxID=44250 RepID=A0ABT4H3J7_PAEAL|nr:hypothetical protein [Paenibacillus alvei]MCY9763546.1 hypothetical protein [Paenibacillus alvei]MCY9765267.1 hypothetical protein [Paenibacillus alvei]